MLLCSSVVASLPLRPCQLTTSLLIQPAAMTATIVEEPAMDSSDEDDGADASDAGSDSTEDSPAGASTGAASSAQHARASTTSLPPDATTSWLDPDGELWIRDLDSGRLMRASSVVADVLDVPHHGRHSMLPANPATGPGQTVAPSPAPAPAPAPATQTPTATTRTPPLPPPRRHRAPASAGGGAGAAPAASTGDAAPGEKLEQKVKRGFWKVVHKLMD